jgi:hypothetical protein
MQDALIAQQRHNTGRGAGQEGMHHNGDLRLIAGVKVRITASGRTFERELASPDFSLDIGQSLDSSIDQGAFRLEFDARFWTDEVRQALLGAEIRNGQLMILHADGPVLAEAAGATTRTVMSTIAMPVNLRSGVDQISVVFDNDGARPCTLRLLWQPWSPEPASGPRPLPVP